MKKKNETVMNKAQKKIFIKTISLLIEEAAGNARTKQYARDLILRLVTTAAESKIALELIADREHGIRKDLIVVLCEKSEISVSQILQAYTIVRGEETLTFDELDNALSILAYGAMRLGRYEVKRLLDNLPNCLLVNKINEQRKQISRDREIPASGR